MNPCAWTSTSVRAASVHAARPTALSSRATSLSTASGPGWGIRCLPGIWSRSTVRWSNRARLTAWCLSRWTSRWALSAPRRRVRRTTSSTSSTTAPASFPSAGSTRTPRALSSSPIMAIWSTRSCGLATITRKSIWWPSTSRWPTTLSRGWRPECRSSAPSPRSARWRKRRRSCFASPWCRGWTARSAACASTLASR